MTCYVIRQMSDEWQAAVQAESMLRLRQHLLRSQSITGKAFGASHPLTQIADLGLPLQPQQY